MEKELLITFEIIEGEVMRDIENPINLTIYSVCNPKNYKKINVKDLEKFGVKKFMKPKFEVMLIPDRFGKKYQAGISAKQLKELFNH